MPILYMVRGLPGCGKTTWAKQQQDENPGQIKRVNKDDLRAMLDNGYHGKHTEEHILGVRDMIVMALLKNGFDVISDDTNLAQFHENRLREIADEAEARFEVMDMTTVTPEVCIERDAKREKKVGEQVIMDMYHKYIANKKDEENFVPVDNSSELPGCYIFDIDGTLAIMGNRSPFEWSKVHVDTVNEPIKELFLSLVGKHKVFIFSGRDSSCKELTTIWLEANGIVGYDGLFMRQVKDMRKDSLVKQELFEQNILGKYHVLGIVDDRPQVCRMWRGLSLPVLQVGDPYKEF